MGLPYFLTNPDPELFYKDNWLVLDVENAADGELICFSYITAHSCVSSHISRDPHFRHKWEHVREVLVAEDYFLVAHQAKYELKYLELDNAHVLVYDTMLAHKAIFSNQRTSYALSDISKHYGRAGKVQHISDLIKAGVDPRDIPASELVAYNLRDIYETLAVFLLQRKELKEKGLHKDFYTSTLLVPVLEQIEKRGMSVDEERFRDVFVRTQGEHRAILSQLEELFGGINPNSTKQLREFIFGDEDAGNLGFGDTTSKHSRVLKTAGGLHSVSQEAISRLVPRTERQRRFKELKSKHTKLNSDLTKLFNKLEQSVKDRQPIRFEYSQVIPVTHRLSSRGINYAIQGQNINREYRSLFYIPNGLCGESDYRTLEFRVAAGLGHDAVARSDIIQEVDVHGVSSSVLTKAGQKTDRQGGKKHTFKPLFAGTTGTAAEMEYYKYFNDRYKQLHEEQEKWVDEVAHTGQLILPTGMRFYWPELRYLKSGHLLEKSAIYNYPIQYFAARLTHIAVINAHYSGLVLHNTVHDSMLAKINEEEIELFENTVVQCTGRMVYDYLYRVYGIDWTVPLGLEIKVGAHWGEKEKLDRKINII